MKLLIEPVIAESKALAQRVAAELPEHDGLLRLTQAIHGAALKSSAVTEAMRRPWSLHRLPVFFLTAALLSFAAWVYLQFFHVSNLTLAIADRDATAVLDRLASGPRLAVTLQQVPGSREAAAEVEAGRVDLAFVQGGIPISPRLLRLETGSPETVLWLVRDNIAVEAVDEVMTSLEGEGSHSVAQVLFTAWGRPMPQFRFEWKAFAAEPALVSASIDAVLVVKDPADPATTKAVAALSKQGFSLRPVPWTASLARFGFAAPTTLPPDFLMPKLPSSPLQALQVSTYLVAREGLTPRRLTEAQSVVSPGVASISEKSFHVSATEASELLQGADALLSILVNIGLAFLALLGLDVMAYRKQFHELNSLVSIISLLQANKDVLGVNDAHLRQQRLLYLSLCSDALSLIASITAFYTQENSSLTFNNLSEVIHQRCDGLKINIQLKVLHAGLG
jgi:hypothetical protein